MDIMTKETLLEIYSRATYTIESPTRVYEITLQPPDEAFKKFLLINRISSWGLITSDNPNSTRLSAEENNSRRADLARHLSGYTILRAVGMDTDSTIHHEVGFFVANISDQELIRIGKLFDQNAVIYGFGNGQADVLWIRD